MIEALRDLLNDVAAAKPDATTLGEFTQDL
jgi:hypothetical protein